MIPHLRQIVLLSLLVLHALSGVGAARAFCVCVCDDGGIVLESREGTCTCCAIETAPAVEHDCDAETVDDGCGGRDALPGTGEHDACSRFTVVREGAVATKHAATRHVSAAALAAVPRWFAAPPRTPSIGPGPSDLDPDPHDPLAPLRTVVLRH